MQLRVSPRLSCVGQEGAGWAVLPGHCNKTSPGKETSLTQLYTVDAIQSSMYTLRINQPKHKAFKIALRKTQ